MNVVSLVDFQSVGLVIILDSRVGLHNVTPLSSDLGERRIGHHLVSSESKLFQ